MDENSVCIANIGPRERNKRLGIGIASLGVGVAATAAMVMTGAAVGWRAALILPFMSAGIGFFQWKEKT